MTTFITCKRCEGSGRLAHFGHVNNGVCLKCRGAGKVVKTKRVVSVVTNYRAVSVIDGVDIGEVVLCNTDKNKAEELIIAWRAMNCDGRIEEREVRTIEFVPV